MHSGYLQWSVLDCDSVGIIIIIIMSSGVLPQQVKEIASDLCASETGYPT